MKLNDGDLNLCQFTLPNFKMLVLNSLFCLTSCLGLGLCPCLALGLALCLWTTQRETSTWWRLTDRKQQRVKYRQLLLDHHICEYFQPHVASVTTKTGDISLHVSEAVGRTGHEMFSQR